MTEMDVDCAQDLSLAYDDLLDARLTVYGLLNRIAVGAECKKFRAPLSTVRDALNRALSRLAVIVDHYGD